jgi:hypothetical protein
MTELGMFEQWTSEALQIAEKLDFGGTAPKEVS